MKKAEKKPAMGIYPRYALTGAAVGLYFGIFYQTPTDPPDFEIAIILSIIAALVTVVIRSWRKHRSFTDIVKDFLGMLVLYSVFLLALAFRQIADGYGGKLAVTLVTTITGTGLGLFWAWRAKASDGQLKTN